MIYGDQLKIGSRVECIETYSGADRGEIATLVGYDYDGDLILMFEEYSNRRHECGGETDYGYGYYVSRYSYINYEFTNL